MILKRIKSGYLSELQEAIFSIATVDLFNPVRPIEQGTFNTRKLDPPTVARLVADMKIQGVRRHQISTAIPLLADPEHIHTDSIFCNITKITEAPELKLSRKGERVVKRFYGAGGNHRMAAVKALADEEKGKINQLEVSIAKQEGIEGAKSMEKLGRLREDLKKAKKRLAGMGKWTVLLYKEG